jgi:hypothetical protein
MSTNFKKRIPGHPPRLHPLAKTREQTWALALIRTQLNIDSQAPAAQISCILIPARIPHIFPLPMTLNGMRLRGFTLTRTEICITTTKMSQGRHSNDHASQSSAGIYSVWPHGTHGFRGSSLRRVANRITEEEDLGAAPLWFSRVRVLTFLLFYLGRAFSLNQSFETSTT